MTQRATFLYANVQAYTKAILDELIEQGVEIDLYYFDTNLNTPYLPRPSKNLTLHPISKVILFKMISSLFKAKPDIIYVSGWQSKIYLICCLLMRCKAVKIVVGFDDQWNGTIKQYLASVLSPLRILKLFYTHAWVCGPYQYEYARKMGFRKKEIIFDLLSANPEIINNSNHLTLKRSMNEKTIVYVGRISPEKGINLALRAWEKSKLKDQNWKLLFIGDHHSSPMSFQRSEQKKMGVEFYEFTTQKKLGQLLQNATFGLLPSLSEQWGVVMHEYSLVGLPVIAADGVGANSHFLINGFNGYTFTSGSLPSLVEAMDHILELDKYTYSMMSENAKLLSNRITVKTAVANLLSILPKQKLRATYDKF